VPWSGLLLQLQQQWHLQAQLMVLRMRRADVPLTVQSSVLLLVLVLVLVAALLEVVLM
jgi:hypothetical protein